MSVGRLFKRLFVPMPPDPVAFWRGRASDPGLSAVMWQNGAYNACAHRDQWSAIDRHLPRRTDSVLDLGCGTGRLTAPLMERFADYVGVDLDAMVTQARRRHPESTDAFVVSRVEDYAFPVEHFDLVLSMACLAAALQAHQLPEVAKAMVRATRSGGRIILLDPFHRMPVLARVSRISAREVIDLFTRHGTRLITWSGMHFVPVRLLLAGSALASPSVTRLAYATGEALNRLAPRLASDYHLIVLEKTGTGDRGA